MIDFERIAAAPVTHEPFAHFVARDTIDTGTLRDIGKDFPPIQKPGVFPLSELTYGERFAALIDDIKSSELEELLSEKLDVDLAGHGSTLVVCRPA